MADKTWTETRLSGTGKSMQGSNLNNVRRLQRAPALTPVITRNSIGRPRRTFAKNKSRQKCLGLDERVISQDWAGAKCNYTRIMRMRSDERPGTTATFEGSASK